LQQLVPDLEILWFSNRSVSSCCVSGDKCARNIILYIIAKVEHWKDTWALGILHDGTVELLFGSASSEELRQARRAPWTCAEVVIIRSRRRTFTTSKKRGPGKFTVRAVVFA
jgi:hypothetical protein